MRGSRMLRVTHSSVTVRREAPGYDEIGPKDDPKGSTVLPSVVSGGTSAFRMAGCVAGAVKRTSEGPDGSVGGGGTAAN